MYLGISLILAKSLKYISNVIPIDGQRRGFLKPNPLTNYENTLVRDFHPT